MILRRELATFYLLSVLFLPVTRDSHAQDPPPLRSSRAARDERTQLRGQGIVVRLGRSPALDDQQIDLMRILGVSVAIRPTGEWAENEIPAPIRNDA
jgi:hypothetical protein